MQYIDTPALVVDLAQVKANLRKFQSYADRYQVAFRPHIKTHKIPRFAAMQIALGAVGISCATLGEAELMADAGIDDIFIAYTIVGKEKIARLLALGKRVRVICGVDSIEGAAMINAAAVAQKTQVAVRVEIDAGFKRAGVQPEEVLPFVKALQAMEGLHFDGIYTFKSATLAGKPSLDLVACAAEEGEILNAVAEELRAAGITVRAVSGGSTPTGAYVAACEGVTEIRAGTYIFYDRSTVAQQVATLDEVAASVLVTVVSTPTAKRAVVDGGTKVFSGDVALDTPPLFLRGHGHIIGREDLLFSHMNEEHGVIVGVDGPTNLRVGDTLSIIPNHICTTVNLFRYLSVREEDGTYTQVPVAAGGLVN